MNPEKSESQVVLDDTRMDGNQSPEKNTNCEKTKTAKKINKGPKKTGQKAADRIDGQNESGRCVIQKSLLISMFVTTAALVFVFPYFLYQTAKVNGWIMMEDRRGGAGWVKVMARVGNASTKDVIFETRIIPFFHLNMTGKDDRDSRRHSKYYTEDELELLMDKIYAAHEAWAANDSAPQLSTLYPAADLMALMMMSRHARFYLTFHSRRRGDQPLIQLLNQFPLIANSSSSSAGPTNAVRDDVPEKYFVSHDNSAQSVTTPLTTVGAKQHHPRSSNATEKVQRRNESISSRRKAWTTNGNVTTFTLVLQQENRPLVRPLFLNFSAIVLNDRTNEGPRGAEANGNRSDPRNETVKLSKPKNISADSPGTNMINQVTSPDTTRRNIIFLDSMEKNTRTKEFSSHKQSNPTIITDYSQLLSNQGVRKMMNLTKEAKGKIMQLLLDDLVMLDDLNGRRSDDTKKRRGNDAINIRKRSGSLHQLTIRNETERKKDTSLKDHLMRDFGNYARFKRAIVVHPQELPLLRQKRLLRPQKHPLRPQKHPKTPPIRNTIHKPKSRKLDLPVSGGDRENEPNQV